MATSTETALTTTWVNIATGAYLAIQNIGNSPLRLFWGADAPTTEHGFQLQPGDGIDNTTFGDGPVWCQASAGVGLVIVNV